MTNKASPKETSQSSHLSSPQSDFHWECQPEAYAWLNKQIRHCVKSNGVLAQFEQTLESTTSTRLFDWVDHIAVPHSKKLESLLEEMGFRGESAAMNYRVLHHPRAQLPRVLLHDHEEDAYAIGIKVESVADFLMVRGITRQIEGTPYSGLRKCCIAEEKRAAFWIVERRAYTGMEARVYDDLHELAYLEAREKWQTRSREDDETDVLMLRTLALAEQLCNKVGRDMAAWIVLEVERAYWERKNTAGQLQKSRQDRLGLGWANHDHHTFRSSRKHFAMLVRLFEMLGFHCRERYYAGAEAGWGAQVMENPTCGLVLFLDVDLSPDEISIDFAHDPLNERDRLGTIGLWCALHGDSILRAGMHHLEAQFAFDALRDDLEERGVGMMQPFSNFPYLKQAFTVGERWTVRQGVVDRLIDEGKITDEEGKKFLRDGAVGSHLENLQRLDGYKGFNQHNVSVIIKKTDPRNC